MQASPQQSQAGFAIWLPEDQRAKHFVDNWHLKRYSHWLTEVTVHKQIFIAGISTYYLNKRSSSTVNTDEWLKHYFNNTFYMLIIMCMLIICFNNIHCPEGTEEAKGLVFEDWSSGLDYHMSRPFWYYSRKIKKALHKLPLCLVRAHWKDLN